MSCSSSPPRTRCEVGGRPAGAGARDEENLTLQVPSDGTVASLRHLLGQLDDAGIEVEQLSIHTPDLDDVFFAVTGRPAPSRLRPREKQPCDEHPRLHPHRFGDDAAP